MIPKCEIKMITEENPTEKYATKQM